MSILTQCGGCQKQYKLSDALAGKKARCKACGETFVVPGLSASPETPASSRSEQPPKKQTRTNNETSRRQSAPAPKRRETSDDPFSNLDALMDLETSGTIDPTANAPVKASRAASRPVENSDDYALTPAAYTPPTPSRRLSFMPSRKAPSSARGSSSRGIGAGAAIFPLLLLIGIAIFVTGLNSPGFARIGSLLLFGMAILMMLVGGLACLFKAFAEGPVTALLYLFFPLYSIYFVLSRFDETKTYIAMYGIGLVCLFGGLKIKPDGSSVGGSTTLFGTPSVAATKLQTKQNLWKVSIALTMYSNSYKGEYPSTLDLLSTVNLDPAMLRSPIDGQKFTYNYFPGLRQGIGGRYVLAYTKAGGDTNTAIALFADGGIEELLARDFTQAIGKNEAIRIEFVDGPTKVVSKLFAPPPPSETLVPESSSGKPPTSSTQPSPKPPLSPTKPEIQTSFKKIDAALRQYVATHDGQFPMSLRELRTTGGLQDADLKNARGVPYFYSNPRLKTPLPAEYILMYDPMPGDLSGRAVLFGDGRVDTIETSAWGEVVRRSMEARFERMKQK